MDNLDDLSFDEIQELLNKKEEKNAKNDRWKRTPPVEQREGYIEDGFTEEHKKNIGLANRGKHTHLNKKQASEVRWLLENTNMTHRQISSHYPCPITAIQSISYGTSFYYVEPTKPKHIAKSSMVRKAKMMKLSKKQAGEIRWLALNSDMTQKEIAKRYPISDGAVCSIKNNNTWKKVKARKPDDFETK